MRRGESHVNSKSRSGVGRRPSNVHIRGKEANKAGRTDRGQGPPFLPPSPLFSPSAFVFRRLFGVPLLARIPPADAQTRGTHVLLPRRPMERTKLEGGAAPHGVRPSRTREAYRGGARTHTSPTHTQTHPLSSSCYPFPFFLLLLLWLCTPSSFFLSLSLSLSLSPLHLFLFSSSSSSSLY